MYVIEDNHDQRPRRRFSQTETNSPLVHNNDENIMYRKKLENFYYENNRKQTPSTKSYNDWKADWGFEFHPINNDKDIRDRTIDTTKPTMNFDSVTSTYDIRNYFPSTVDEVTDAVVATIASVLQQPTTQQGTRSNTRIPATLTISSTDPNVLQNTVYNDNVMKSRRPVRHPHHDMGRIGIELDWSVPPSSTTTVTGTDDSSSQQDQSTVRYASLILAGKLSTYSFSNNLVTLSKQENGKTPQSQTLRPIAIYYNTVQQALVASRQLLQLKRLEMFRLQQQHQYPSLLSMYDTIHIRSLCQDNDVPDALTNKIDRHDNKSMSRRLATGQIDPMTNSTGIILIVQPTNYNDEFHSPWSIY